MDDMTPVSNKLAALAQAIVDAADDATEDLSPSAAAALMSLKARGPQSVGTVAQLVGLTHSAAVRLVDRLEKDWLVRRQRRGGREVMVELTSRGKRRASTLQEKRIIAAEGFVKDLNPSEIGALDLLLHRLLDAVVEDGGDIGRLCRMCDTGTCDCHHLHPTTTEEERIAAAGE
ncbi:MarR family protein [Hartmannibacter diazotrophicus]|uniref:MarR family protein n=1 Tax=Hartmannibacter diazotrophicus TaxID=1482074 RepID=A0A2C9D1T3_9HYPH|nr:MarR family transcriptional regulator [Hartmannibacter diazotrophicus]SON54129.1 MarR family protein [Hartmannibacter diazotrophicus]